MSLTVEEILNAARPGLRERAQEAWQQKLERDQQALDAEGEELRPETYRWLYEVLGMSDAELVDLELRAGYFNGQRAQLEFEIEGIEFRSRYRLEKVHEVKEPNGSMRPIHEHVLTVEVKTGSSWSELPSLAKLGERLEASSKT